MELFEHFYLNYISLSSIIVVVFLSFLVYFYVSVSDKSEPSKLLMLFFLLTLFFYIPYISSAFFHPNWAFHRWGTVPFVLFAGMIMSQFMLRNPRITSSKTTYGLLILLWYINIIWSLYFFYKTYDAPKVFKFTGHLWDFDVDQISKTTGLLILLNMVAGYLSGLWRSLRMKEVRWSVLGLTLSYILGTILPGITNILSRDGGLSRGFHQTVTSVAVITGFFVLTMIYINTTKDKTTFMAKIIGISYATFMLMMAPISLITLQNTEDSYNTIYQQETRLLLKGEPAHEEFRYLAALPIQGEQKIRLESNLGDSKVRLEVSNTEYLHSYMYALVDSLSQDKNAQTQEGFSQLFQQKIATVSHPVFKGYKNLILKINLDISSETLDVSNLNRTKAILTHIDNDYRKILTFYNKTKALENKKFRELVIKKLEEVKESKIVYPIALVALDIVNKSKHEGLELKQELLPYLLPMRAPGSRHYRNPTELGKDAFVSFMQVDLNKGLVYEVGYSYLKYRAYVHKTAINLFWIILAVSVIVLVGFRFFFSGALVSPLNDLLAGVKEVNEGDMSVHVPIRVKDEIGFLSNSFNGMVRSIRESQIKLKDYADNLEEKVEERTVELQASLDHVQTLKTQQDGDYFLTSLLTKPLNSNQYKGENLSVDFLISQKKKFEFRNRKDELGGDLCSTHRIKLKGKDYLVFMNADAMGKSIQGAGGALVLGSVFESLIMRTMLSVRSSNYHPERWLKNAFIELHKVFEAFNGSMLISVAFGLVEEATGFMYHINAEHPYSVSYLNGKAKFLSEGILFRKLGTIGIGDGIHILTHQLQSGEIFLAGSDGRDDILMGFTEDGERIINDDEDLFLEKVEKSDCNLEKIVELIEEQGEMTDDLSLLKINFSNPLIIPASKASSELQTQVRSARTKTRAKDWEGALSELDKVSGADTKHPMYLKEKAGILFKLQQFDDALKHALAYQDQVSSDSDIIYLTSLIYKRMRKFNFAADYSERVRLRKPEYADNLVNLADIYRHMGEPKRSSKILSEALESEPENKQGLRLRELIAT